MISKDELETCTKRVESLLEVSLECRESDKFLISKYLKEFHGLDLAPEILSQIPSFESITRARRKLQEDGSYPPKANIKDKREEIQQEVTNWAVGI